MEFWTTLIKVLDSSQPEAFKSLQDNCTHITGSYWIMEGDVDALRDDGVKLEEVAEGAVGSLGDLSEDELKKVCRNSYGVEL